MQEITTVRLHIPCITPQKDRLVDPFQKYVPEMAMVFLRPDRRVGSFLHRILERNRPKEYPQVESERERRTADSLCQVAVERLVVDDVDLVGGVPPRSLGTELREPLRVLIDERPIVRPAPAGVL